MNNPFRFNFSVGHSGKAIIKIVLIIIIVLGIGAYSLYQARNLIKGPEIDIQNPKNGATISNPVVTIDGTANNITYLSLNDRQIYTDNNGDFKEELLLSPGYNVWQIQAKDKFGRTVSKKIELVLQQSS